MPQHKERPGQVGDFWLSKRRGSEAWCRTGYDGRTRQTSRESLGTEDFSEAKERLVEWFLNNHRPQDASPDDVQLEALFIAYYNDHAKALPSEESARISSRERSGPGSCSR
jgi:hypothetical protein